MMRRTITLLALAALPVTSAAIGAQDMIHVRDLTIEDKAIPVRLMGYGLVIGLDGTGDKSSGGKSGGKDQPLRPVATLGEQNGAKHPEPRQHRRQYGGDGEIDNERDEQEFVATENQ